MAFDIITDVLVVLAVAVLVGELFEQVGLPSVAGELLSGLVLGPTFLGVVAPNAQTAAISEIALFFVVLLIGFEMTTGTVRKHIFPSIVISLTSFAIPFLVVVAAAALLLPFGFAANVLVALAIAVPSISIVSVLVMEWDLVQKETGQLILSSVTITDIVAFVMLAGASGTLGGTITVVVLMGLFLLVFALVDWQLNAHPHAFRDLLGRAADFTKREELSFALLIAGGLLVAVILQGIGISYILGAFFAGLIIHDGLVGKNAFRRTADTLAKMNRAFFIPVFFGLAGVEASFPASQSGLLIPLGVLLVVAVLPATLLTYFAAKRLMKVKEEGGPRRIAFILAGRGAVGIVIASVALSTGLIGGTAYSLVVVGTVVVSIVVPVLAGREKRD
ncbi:MAG: cation:proton antiporter [Thaumarchaeota archaeon]|nr:cation:proton antiporter [Nitrososphaerota archaeon]